MKIFFEEWIKENQITNDAKNLFQESISCYRIGAYRSAFIMSYIALQNILKQRILNAKFQPSNITKENWEFICKKLRDEDKWDKEIADCVKRQAPKNIFLISSSIISQYESFRCYRNICAHGKSGKIEYYHIESLWGFIQENFSKFVINGSKSGILQMIENHYDTTITAVGTDPSYIVTNIELGIKEDELIELLEDFYNLCESNSQLTKSFSTKWKQIDLWDKLVNESAPYIQAGIIEFLKEKHSNVIDDFITRYPHKLDLFMNDSIFLRKLWKEIIFQDWSKNQIGTWHFLDKIIDRDIIPKAEKDTFNKDLYKFVGKNFPKIRSEILKKTDYFNILKSYLFDSNTYEYPNTFYYANENIDTIINYLDVFGMDKDSVKQINSIINRMNYGDFIDNIHSYLLKDDNWDKFRAILEENGITDYSKKLESDS